MNLLDAETLLRADPRIKPDAKIEDHASKRPRAHLSASRLTGPYKNRGGNSAWYVSLTARTDLRRLLDTYFT